MPQLQSDGHPSLAQLTKNLTHRWMKSVSRIRSMNPTPEKRNLLQMSQVFSLFVHRGSDGPCFSRIL
jgi:hypothetical protein